MEDEKRVPPVVGVPEVGQGFQALEDGPVGPEARQELAQELRIRPLVAQADEVEILPQGGFEGGSGFGYGPEGFQVRDEGLGVGAGPETGREHLGFEARGMVDLFGEAKETP